jgi:hypothetical protein
MSINASWESKNEISLRRGYIGDKKGNPKTPFFILCLQIEFDPLCKR